MGRVFLSLVHGWVHLIAKQVTCKYSCSLTVLLSTLYMIFLQRFCYYYLYFMLSYHPSWRYYISLGNCPINTYDHT